MVHVHSTVKGSKAFPYPQAANRARIPRGSSVDLWSEIIDTEGQEQQQQRNDAVYRRRKPQNKQKDSDSSYDLPILRSREHTLKSFGRRDCLSPFATLLAICGQSVPSTLSLCFLNSETIVKVGEGTFGEAFKIGNYVCKIVPIDGDLRVNGEAQKKSEELLEEVVLSRTVNLLRGNNKDACNSCRTFIETMKVCQGPYDAALIRAWEDWDEKHGSENDHPKEFPEKQCYVAFVLEHGGKDLESFVLLNFDEARSLLVQVYFRCQFRACQFLHGGLICIKGNILVNRSDSATLQFTLDGRHMFVKTYGLLIYIIDFTLSRINTGDDILFLDPSSDPDLFRGPKGDKQSEAYRNMKDVTEDCWEEGKVSTNVLWLAYLVDILLMKKSFKRTSKNERDLRSLKKRLDKYHSAKEAMLDPCFIDLLLEHDR
ncbi:hypothetical protein L6164_010412 [Bauhinia variegata]|uniref:Uncharacterized protein n=1 Tax=Bauhinia variegata TaxID=167791 RepID=A0ACB9PN88_BAUVA|nr:hypothetical protein L6164_010412 [Bauhinia variegata]